ncbi:MAG TPA: hypothetical protein PLK38_04115, partial [Methanoregulaceae archaeon]|nr:hypothetical protein [Methanoregulaceae archaeon]
GFREVSDELDEAIEASEAESPDVAYMRELYSSELRELIPLAFALFIRARYEEAATGLVHTMTMAANLSLAAMFIGYFVAYFDDSFGILGTGGILAAVLLIIGAVVIGYLLGGTNKEIKKVLALGTSQRNLAAAFAVATGNFATNPDVMLEVMDVAVIGFILLMVIAGELGRRSSREAGKDKKTAVRV